MHEVVREPYTVEEKMSLIEETVGSRRARSASRSCFRDDTIKMEVIVTFIAILELVKRGTPAVPADRGAGAHLAPASRRGAE